jgi:hypothetical protein
MSVIARDSSLLSVSLGKTMGPAIAIAAGMRESVTTSVMLALTYALPFVFTLFINKIIKKHGEVKVLKSTLWLSLGAAVLSMLSGFYGMAAAAPSPLRTAALFTAVGMLSLAVNLRGVITNNLLDYNRSDFRAAEDKNTAGQSAAAPQKVTLKYLADRVKEVFSRQKGDKSLKDIVFYNLSFIWKNVGTLLFLALPFGINQAVWGASWLLSKASVIDAPVALGLDFSASFPIYAAYGIYTIAKAYKANLRDATIGKKTIIHERDLISPKTAAAPEPAANADEKISLLKVFFKKPGVKSLAVAMSLASANEFILSSAYSAQMNALFSGEPMANFLVAASVYAPLIMGRILGMGISNKFSSGSMYAFFSLLTLFGGVYMTFNTASAGLLLAGSIVASFGVGNFFTQMYSYIKNRHDSVKRQLAVIISITLLPSTLLSMPSAALGALIAPATPEAGRLLYGVILHAVSLFLTTKMMADSSLVKYLVSKFTWLAAKLGIPLKSSVNANFFKPADIAQVGNVPYKKNVLKLLMKDGSVKYAKAITTIEADNLNKLKTFKMPAFKRIKVNLYNPVFRTENVDAFYNVQDIFQYLLLFNMSTVLPKDLRGGIIVTEKLDMESLVGYKKSGGRVIWDALPRPITRKEWAEVKALFAALNKHDIVHADILQNISFVINEKGKLEVNLIDFGYTSAIDLDKTFKKQLTVNKDDDERSLRELEKVLTDAFYLQPQN